MPGAVEVWAGRCGDAWHRLTGPKAGPRVVVTSIPKSGTHLVISALRHVPGIRVCPEIILGNVSTAGKVRRIEQLGAAQVLVGHLVYEPEVAAAATARGAKVILMVRDPRDVVVSLAKFIPKDGVKHRYYEYFNRVLTNDADRIMACIRGIGGEHAKDGRPQPDVASLYRSYLDWPRHHDVLVCRFERLVGAQGGGDDAAQREDLARLFAFVGLEQGALDEVARGTYSRGSLTFRKGEVGDWVRHFSPEHKAAFKDLAGDILVELGYEKDDAW